MRGKLVISLLATAVLLLPALPARAAVTIGSDLSQAALNATCAAAACTTTSLTHPSAQLASPIDGVVVRWRLKQDGAGGQVRLEVIRPDGAGAFTGVSTGATENLSVGPPATNTFLTGQPISSGDRIALDILSNASSLGVASGSQPGVTFARWLPPLAVGETRAPTTTVPPSIEVLINADIEADADCDGLGDETQDPLVAGGCLPVAPPAVLSPAVAIRPAGLVSRAVTTKGKSIALEIACPADGNCTSNRLSLVSSKPVSLSSAAAARAKRIAVGSASFTIPAGKTQTVTVPLTKRAKRTLRLRRKLATTATITGGGATTTAGLTIKLK
jgi:hypothetical protein